MSRYHSFLRVSALTTALVLVFDSGMLIPATKNLSDTTVSYMASVGAGMFAQVEPNEINTLSAQIAEQKRDLDARETALKEREIAARNFGSGETTDYSTYIISFVLFILTVLIVLNYVMDWTRARKQYYENQVA